MSRSIEPRIGAGAGGYGYPPQSHSHSHSHSHSQSHSQSLSHQPPPLGPPPHLPPLATLPPSSSQHQSLPPLKHAYPNGSASALPHAHAHAHAHAPPPPYPSAYRYTSGDPRDISTSPTALKSVVGMDSTSPRDDESGSDDEDEKEKHKLEVRREKNRVKQRNLRMRRANHISELENNITSLRGEHASLSSAFSALQQREAHLESWIRDLESALFRQGLSGEVDAIRRAYSAVSVVSVSASPPGRSKRKAPGSGHGHGPGPGVGPGAGPVRDPLNTLVQAALAPEHANAQDGPGSAPWERPERPTSRQSEAEEKKRKRDSDGPSTFWKSSNPERERERERSGHGHRHGQGHVDQPRRVSVSVTTTQDRTREHSPRRLPAETVSPLSASGGRINPQWRSNSIAPVPTQGQGQGQAQPRPGSASSHLSPPEWAAPSPRSIRIEDLLSPMAPPTTSLPSHEATPQMEAEDAEEMERERERQRVSGEAETEEPRRWSVGEASVVDNVLGGGGGVGGGGAIAVMSASRPIYVDLSIPSDALDALDPPPSYLHVTHLYPHSSVLTARSLLLGLYPTPLPFPVPPLPNLSPQHQQILLVALSNLSPPHVAEHFRSRQLRTLPAADAKIILEYQSSPFADPRLILFPIAILRARVIAYLKKGMPIDVSDFISHTLRLARVFGDPLDPDAWEMPDPFWDIWEQWFPGGREYCGSLKAWRRRQGHVGSTVEEMILGIEGEKGRMKEEVGKPPGWKIPASAAAPPAAAA